MMVSDVYRTLWRSKLLVVLITAIVVAVAFVLTSRQTIELYTAYSLVAASSRKCSARTRFSVLWSPVSDSPARMSASRRRPAYGRSSILGLPGGH